MNPIFGFLNSMKIKYEHQIDFSLKGKRNA